MVGRAVDELAEPTASSSGKPVLRIAASNSGNPAAANRSRHTDEGKDLPLPSRRSR